MQGSSVDVNGLAPPYLAELLEFNNLPGSRRATFYVSTSNNHSFSVCVPKMWSKLPSFIRDSSSVDVFKSRLKTLFKRSYDC